MNSFEELIAKLDEYEKEMDIIWDNYNPDDSLLKIEISALKMSILFYQYLIDVFEYIGDGFVDILLSKVRKGLTILTYILSTSTIFVSPQITPAALLSSFYLHFKNKKDNKKMVKPLSEEQVEILFDRMDKVGDLYIEKSDTLFDRTIDFESEEFMEKFEEPEKSQRILCNKLVNAIKSNGKLTIENQEQESYIRELIKSAFNIDNENFKELIKQAKKEYDRLVNKTVKLNNKDERLSILTRFIPNQKTH